MSANDEYPTIDDLFPSRFLKAIDLDGRDLTVTITDIDTEEVGHYRDKKPVLYFDGGHKPLVMNKTNATSIGKLYGGNTRDWIGKKITLFETDVQFRGEWVKSVRVRPYVSQDAPVQELEEFPI